MDDATQNIKLQFFHTLEVERKANSYWWLGITSVGHHMPFTEQVSYDTYGKGYGNQCQPLVLSNDGDVIWSDDPLAFDYTDTLVTVSSRKRIIHEKRKTLRDAYKYASRTFFPPTGTMPGDMLFTHPQYNTWIELGYNQTQQGVLKYAHGIIDNGYPPGVLMIDTNWSHSHGIWKFNRTSFPYPSAMVKELKQLGFKVMLWICPMVSPDSVEFRHLRDNDALMKSEKGTTALFNWWDGYSAMLDLSKEFAQSWLHSSLQELIDNYDIDGFKFDVGDASYYAGNNLRFDGELEQGGLTPNQHSEIFGKLGLKYPYNELRCVWKTGGLPIAQRLVDKCHNWEQVRQLIPQMLSGSLMGYPFMCPDMIGGGLLASVEAAIADGSFDQELLVRSAQCHALMPMMQFSLAPWKVLDTVHHDAIIEALKVRDSYKDYILKLAQKAAKTGEPIMRPMEYNYPKQGYANIKDQFMLGEDVLVAPIVTKGAKERTVILPDGTWLGSDGCRYKGGKVLFSGLKINSLLYFKKL